MLIGKNTAFKFAMRDISEYLHTKNWGYVDGYGDVWAVTPQAMKNKETNELNRKLGLHKINKHGKKMSRFL